MKLNEQEKRKSFSLRFQDRNAWNTFKEDLKVIFRNHQIKFQYSEQSPKFYIRYKSNSINIIVTWEEDSLLFLLESFNFEPETLNTCIEIYDLLILFSGEIIDGTEPYNW